MVQIGLLEGELGKRGRIAEGGFGENFVVVGKEINDCEIIAEENAKAQFGFAGDGEGEVSLGGGGFGNFIRSGDGFERKDWREGIGREGSMVLVIGPGVACEEEGKGGEQNRPEKDGGVGEHFCEFQI